MTHARQAAEKIVSYTTPWFSLTRPNPDYVEKVIQEAIDSATAELREENQKLKDRVDDFISRDWPGFKPANKDTPALPIPDVFEGGLIDED